MKAQSKVALLGQLLWRDRVASRRHPHDDGVQDIVCHLLEENDIGVPRNDDIAGVLDALQRDGKGSLAEPVDVPRDK